MKNNWNLYPPGSDVTKTLKVAKVTLLFLMVFLLNMSANAFTLSKRYTITMRDVAIKEVLNRIEMESDVSFFYQDEASVRKTKVTVNFENSSLTEILDQLFAGTSLTYQILDKYVAIIDKAKMANQQDNLTVNGKVVDANGEPIPGASIVVKGTTTGTITDMDGNFTLTGVPEDAVLAFSFVGMKTVEVPVAGQTSFNVVLQEETLGLDEVVVIGYGTQKKENLTGAISQVGPEILENRSVTSVSQALQGTMTGVTVQQTDGRPGANANIRIRGFSSLNSDGALVIVDGIPGNLNTLNPNDIESISVLKDAASAAIYGARAAEGVILVTTKSGKDGKIEVKYQGSLTIKTPTRFPEQAHSYDGAVLANLSAQNAGSSPFYSEALIEAMRDPSISAIPREDGQEWEYVADFDWAGYFLKSSLDQNHNVSISGGGNGNKYLLSAAWLDQNGYFSKYGPDNFDRYNLRLNMNNSLIKDKLTLDTRLSLSSSERNENSQGVEYLVQSVIQAGTSMPLYNPDGSYARYRMQQNTMQILKEAGFDKNLSNRFEGRMSLNWNVSSDFEIKAQVGYNVNWSKGTLFGRGYYKYHPSFPPDRFGWINQPNRVILDNVYSRFYTSQILANYYKKINKHNFKLFVGGSVEENYWESAGATRFNILGNELPALNLGTADDAQNSYSANEWGIVSGFSRLNYDFAGKYLFEANFRADASSRFSDKNKWGFFPSFSGGWRVTEEEFMQSQSIFSNLKIRISYGEVGNQSGLGLYDHIPVYQISNGLIPFPSSDAQHIFNPRLPSEERTWETIATSNIGLEMGFLKNKLIVEADYYIKRNKDMLIGIEIPSVIGINVPTNNNGELETKGWETTLRWNDIVDDIGLKYSIGLNLYDQTDEIVSLNQEFVNIASGIRNLQGYPVNSIFAYEADGYFQTQEEVDNWAFQHARTGPGDIKYVDQDGDEKITQPNDLKYVGNTTPRYVYGININAEFKNFDLSVLFQGVGKRNYYLSGRVVQPYYEAWDNNSFAIHQDYWKVDNPNATFPRPVMRSSWNYQWSTHWLQDASYVRLKNLQLGYSLPSGILGTELIRIYFNAENLWEKTDLLMFDPELNNSSGQVYPLNRGYSFGVNVTF